MIRQRPARGRRLDGGIAAAGRRRRRIQDVDVEFRDVFEHRGVHVAQEVMGRRASSRQGQCPLFTRFISLLVNP